MQQNKVDIIDRGWESMHVILDREMPQKKRRKGLFFWLSGLGFGLLLIGLIALSMLNSKGNNPELINETQDLQANKSQLKNDNEDENEALIRSLDLEKGISLNDTEQLKTEESIHKDLTVNENNNDNQSVHETQIINENTSTLKSDIPTKTIHETFATVGNETLNENSTINVTQSIITNKNESENSPSNNISPYDSNQSELSNSSAQLNTDKSNIKNALTTTKSKLELASALKNKRDKISANPDIKNLSGLSTLSQSSSINSNTQQTPLYSIENKKLDLVSLIPLKPLSLDLPDTSKLPMHITLVDVNKPMQKIKQSRNTYGEFILAGIYAHKATGSGIESNIGLRREVSSTVSVLFHTGIGFLNIDNPPNFAELDLSTFRGDVPQGLDGAQGSPAADNESVDTGGLASGEVNIEITPEQLKQLSSSNLDEIFYATAKVGIQWTPNQKRFRIGSNIGIDYVLDLNFNQLYIADNQLTFDNTTSNNLTIVDLNEDASLLPFAELRSSYAISQIFNIDVVYKNYFKSIFPSQESNWLNQFKLGLTISLPLKNK